MLDLTEDSRPGREAGEGCNNCGVRLCTPEQVAAFVKGKRLAVDLSCWVVQAESQRERVPPEMKATFYLRNAFFRALRLATTKFGGALPLFVSDPIEGSQDTWIKNSTRMIRLRLLRGQAPLAPHELERAKIGGKPMRRSAQFIRKCERCLELFRLMGMPGLVAPGEAEALCAQLTVMSLADAVVSPDGDALCFGATCVIRNLVLTSNREAEAEVYSAREIQDRLGLHRGDLVAAMLLLGSDFDSGVPLIGPAKARTLIRQLNAAETGGGGGARGMGTGGVGTRAATPLCGSRALDAVLKWADGGEDDGIAWVADPRVGAAGQAPRRKPTHCGRCGQLSCPYAGKRTKACPPAQSPCDCQWCRAARAYQAQKSLAAAKERVQSLDGGLSQQVVALYASGVSDEQQAEYRRGLTWLKPDLPALEAFLHEHLAFDKGCGRTRKMLLPLATAFYFRQPSRADYVPYRVVGQRRIRDRRLFQVLWRLRDEDPAALPTEPGKDDTPQAGGDEADDVSDAAPGALKGEGRGQWRGTYSERMTEEGADFVEADGALVEMVAEWRARATGTRRAVGGRSVTAKAKSRARGGKGPAAADGDIRSFFRATKGTGSKHLETPRPADRATCVGPGKGQHAVQKGKGEAAAAEEQADEDEDEDEEDIFAPRRPAANESMANEAPVPAKAVVPPAKVEPRTSVKSFVSPAESDSAASMASASIGGLVGLKGQEMVEEGEDLTLRERLERRMGASAARRRGAFAVEEEGGLDGGPAEIQACQKLAQSKSTNAEEGKGMVGAEAAEAAVAAFDTAEFQTEEERIMATMDEVAVVASARTAAAQAAAISTAHAAASASAAAADLGSEASIMPAADLGSEASIMPAVPANAVGEHGFIDLTGSP